MGYTVQLLTGDVFIPAAVFPEALEAVKALDRTRPELKVGHRGPGGSDLHWAFVDTDLQQVDRFPEMLAAWRFDPILLPGGDVLGVQLSDSPRSQGQEEHLWRALAPFVRAGGRMDWVGEDDAVWRWRFDGAELRVIGGTLRFDDD
ncbi:MAG: hypothetical protein GY701_13545 [Sulfitobacter sp.]|nr:hypothetical protein [Sulfitobacter sp.]